MLKCWTSHTSYCNFISNGIPTLSSSDTKRLKKKYQTSLAKLTSLDLDSLHDLLAPYYSSTGRPALYQPEIFRSFLLMIDTGETSIRKWVDTLRSDDLMAFMIGCIPGSTPSIGSHYDFINRLWLRHTSLERKSLKRLRKVNFNRKSKTTNPKKGHKLPSRKPGVVKIIANFFSSARSLKERFEKLLQQIFVLIAVVPSLKLGLIEKDNFTVAGDGTCVPTSSSPYGVKKCDCHKNGTFNCKCDRHFSDIDARWGWDSSKNQWFYGHGLYMLSCYNKKLHIDLPVYFRFVNANRHDSVTGIVALAEYRELCPDLPIKNIVLDSAHDNYPTYHLCQQWDIIPFIDLNPSSNGNLTYPGAVTVNEKGVPICIGGHPMVNWGFCRDKNSRKWRCPLACGKIEECSCKPECSPSEYGRVIYTKPSDDPRIFTPVPRGTKKFKDTFKTRTCSERVNTRVLNDYKVESLRVHGKKRYSFFTMIACIQIHLDARLKQMQTNQSA